MPQAVEGGPVVNNLIVWNLDILPCSLKACCILGHESLPEPHQSFPMPSRHCWPVCYGGTRTAVIRKPLQRQSTHFVSSYFHPLALVSSLNAQHKTIWVTAWHCKHHSLNRRGYSSRQKLSLCPCFSVGVSRYLGITFLRKTPLTTPVRVSYPPVWFLNTSAHLSSETHYMNGACMFLHCVSQKRM